MPDPFAVYVACEAVEARQKADLAELRAFVNGYHHAGATPEERRRYVEGVGKLYPEPTECREVTATQKRVIGGIVVGLFVWFAVGAAIGKWRYGEVGEGLACALASLLVSAIVAGGLILLWLGVSLLFGFL